MQPDDPQQLPDPGPDALAHSRRVAASIAARIDAAGGSLSFGEFMQHALYAPGLGYSAAAARKCGADRDALTAPDVSPLFPRVVARQFAPLLAAGGSVLEPGAGSGAFAVDFLRACEALDALPARYAILEVSPELRERQQALIERELPALAGRVEWLDGLPRAFRGVVVANELADALPVERFLRTADGVDELRVARDGERFRWQRRPAGAVLAGAVAAIEADLGRCLPDGYVSEVSPALAGWLAELAAGLDEALVLLFDYGLPRREYYAPERSGGWLRCHFRHRAHDDPLILPGIQDITAWVDFTAAAEAAHAAGLRVAGYQTQAEFLLHGGLVEEYEAFAGDDAARLELSRQVKLLTLPGEMGEHFKCLALARGDVPLPAPLGIADRSHSL